MAYTVVDYGVIHANYDLCFKCRIVILLISFFTYLDALHPAASVLNLRKFRCCVFVYPKER